MKKGIKQNTIKISIKVLIAVLALFLFNIDAKAEVTFTQNFNYTGGQQSLTVPYQGLYKLETWGAQGGSQTGVAEQSGYTSTIAGGYGGYSTGYVFLNAGEVIYINVGGQGGNITGRGYGGAGGYNGGGAGGSTWSNYFVGSGGGGGATHIATASGLLSSLSNNRNSILMVSGGGGGASWLGIPGGGGGYVGGSVTDHGKTVSGGSQTGGYAFGLGQNGMTGYDGGSDCEGTGGGGGGFYGGYASYARPATEADISGGGGSGYIGNTKLVSYNDSVKHMTGYNVTTSTVDSTRTQTTTCASSTPTADCAKAGNGYARVTLVEPHAYLQSLTVNKGSLVETFASDKLDYTWIIPKNTYTFTDEDVAAVAYDPSSTVIIPESVPYEQDGDTFEIEVITDNVAREKYTLTMQRFVSDDARLSSLTSDIGKFNKEFDKDDDDYLLEIFDDVDKVNISATAFEQDAVVIDGIGEITLEEDETEHTVTVQAEDGTIKIYSVLIRKNMYLKDITVEGLEDYDCVEGFCTFKPTFNPETEDYKITVPFDYDKLDVTYVPSHEGLTVGIRVNNANYVKNYYMSKVKNVVYFNIYNNSNEIVKTYTVSIIREKPDEGKLKSLKVNKGRLVEEFRGTKYDYTWIIPKGTTAVTKDDLVAKLTDNGSVLNMQNSVTYTQDGDTYEIKVTMDEKEEFNYVGREQTFEAPYTGIYKLETWGAQGGSQTGVVEGNGYSSRIVGGYGGYSVGYVELDAGDTLYINVGGQGGSITARGTGAAGGYNGGGSGGTAYSNYFVGSAGGGGATHISFQSGLLRNLSNNRDKILIVSGGGGGASWIATPGSGGGIAGGNSAHRTTIYGGTQSSGYAFGQGQNGIAGYDGPADCEGTGGGGGGFYGGYASQARPATEMTISGAGGSGYIGNTRLISSMGSDKHMVGFNVARSSEESTRTDATTCASATPTAECAKAGNGYAKITLFDAEDYTKTYTLSLQMEISDDARLATLTSDKGIFTEEFDKDKDEYVLEMYHKETSVTFDATPFEQDATIIDGLGEVDLPTDETYHNITVQAEDGTIKIYTVIIRRNMYIEDLGLNGLDDLYCKSYECHMTPEFRPEIIDYEYRVPLDYNILDAYYEPASAEHRSEMTINGEPYVDGYELPYTGITTVQVHVYNDSDEIVKTYTMNVIKEYKYTEEFDYTGESETYIAPRTGKYLIEIWGAQGGTFGPGIGGYGAYSTGSIDLTKKDNIFVTVGGQGVQNTTPKARSAGGYNGGGSGGTGSNGYPEQAGGSGGGASHVAITNRGTLVNYNANRNDVLIVAGGGGGGSYTAGGAGGGYIGNSNPQTGAYVSHTYPVVTGGTQTAGANFAVGGDGRNALDEYYAAGGTGGGGGGWYGGNAYQYTGDYSSSGGAGGSGYIANSDLMAYEDIEKHMTCYNCATSNEETTRTQTTTCHSETPTTDCSKEGNGYAKITLLETDTMLESLSVDDVTIVEPFDKYRTEYTWIIPKGKDEFTSDDIEAVLLHPEKAHIEWPSEPVQFTKDGDKFTFKVVADNGEEDTYTLTMVRYKSDDARLKTLESDKGILSPEFNPDENSYIINVFEDVDKITLDAETIDPDATISSGIGEIELEENEVTTEILVTAEDGTTNIYTVTIRKDAYLLYLGLNGLENLNCVENECNTVPPFEPGINEYNIDVPFEYTNINVYYLLANKDYTVQIKLNGNAYADGASLPVGESIVVVDIYNANNVLVNTYTMNVNRQKGSYATLETLEVNVGDLENPFNRDVEEYTWILPDNVSDNLETYLSYTTTDPAATIELVPSSISYTGEGSKFDIVVTAEDGTTTKTYTINLQQDIIEDIEVEENMVIAVGETKNLYVNGLPEGSIGKYLYEIDQNAIALVYDNGDVYALTPGTATVTVSVKNHPEIESKVVHVTVVSDKLESDIYDVRDTKYDSTDYRMVVGATDGTLISEFKDNMLNPNEYIKIYDENGDEVSDDEIVKTGLTIKLEIDGTVYDEAAMVVKGDVDGDGFINVTDYIAVLNHALALEQIDDYIRFVAGDVAEDQILNVTDYIKIMDYALGNIDSINE